MDELEAAQAAGVFSSPSAGSPPSANVVPFGNFPSPSRGRHNNDLMQGMMSMGQYLGQAVNEMAQVQRENNRILQRLEVSLSPLSSHVSPLMFLLEWSW